MLPDNIRQFLIKKEEDKLLKAVTFDGLIAILNALTPAEKSQIMRVVRRNTLIKTKALEIITPVATSAIDGYITDDCFPAELIQKLLNG